MSEIYKQQPELSDREQRIERNKERVRIEDNNIILAEGQSAFDNGKDTYLLGPLESSQIDVFQTLEHDTGYDLTSEGYLACAEVTGSNASGQNFLIHALDHLKMKQHMQKMLELPEAEIPNHVVIRLDQERADEDSYKRMAKQLFPETTEVEFKTFLDP